MHVQVLADIEKEAGSFYGQVSSRPQGSMLETNRMQRGSTQLFSTKQGKRVCLEVINVELDKLLALTLQSLLGELVFNKIVFNICIYVFIIFRSVQDHHLPLHCC